MVLAALTVLLALGTSAQADLINGDFEAGGTGWTTQGIAFFPTSGGNGIAVLNENDAYSYPDGTKAFDFSSITQQFTRSPAQTRLEFDYHLSGPASETDYFQILLNGAVTEVAATNNPALLDGNWHHASYDISSLPADPSQNMIVFRLKGYNDHPSLSSVELDNVRLVAVPVPAAAVLASLGLACAARRLRRS